MNKKRSWLIPLGMWTVFEIVAVTLWLTKDNLFYLLNSRGHVMADERKYFLSAEF